MVKNFQKISQGQIKGENFMKYKDIIWDFDGTLADTYPAIVEIIQKVLHSYGIYESDEWILETIRTETTSVVVNFCVEKYHKFTKDEFFETYSKLNDQIENYTAMKLIDGVVDALKFVKENGGRNFIITNRQENLLGLVKMLKIDQYFDGYEYVGKNGFKNWKPEPEMFFRLMKDYKIDPTKTLTVGDRRVDLDAGINAKLPVCLYNAILLPTDPKPDYIVPNIKDIINIIK